VYKVQGLEARVKKVEDVISGATAQQADKPLDIKNVKALFKKGNMVFGNQKAKALVVEFSDPSCPYCHAAAYGADEIFQGKFQTVENGGKYQSPVQAFRKLAEEGKIGYVTLYANGHGAGELTAQALYCSYEQGKYWEAHDLLFTKVGYDLINNDVKNDKANAPILVDYLAQVVDAGQLQTCLESGKYAKKLTEDMQSAQTLNFSGTPMFVVNTKKFAGAYSYENMKADVETAMK
jgi:protein-disulfide isomerase